jgi:hypothetical protein
VAPVVYVGMPRGLAEGFLGGGRPAASSIAATGFRDHVQLGSQGILRDSQRTVMRVSIASHDDIDPLLGKPLRLRGAVLDAYDPSSGTWRRGALASATDRRLPMNDPTFPRPSNPRGPLNFFDGQASVVIRAETLDYEVVVAPNELAPPGPVAFRGFGVNVPLREREPELLTNRGEPLPAPAGPQFQEGPIRGLALRLLADAGVRPDPEQWDWKRRAASAFARHLQTEFTYTRELAAPADGEDPIEMFLFDAQRGRRGHCEYFASALAALCLSVEIPARVVTGYVASEFEPETGSYLVRDSHAHAWVEAEVRPGLWEEFDGAPASAVQREHQAQGLVAAAFRRAMDAMQMAWVEGVVAFNRERQTNAFRALSVAPLDALRAFNQRLGAMVENERALAQDNEAVYRTRLAGWIVMSAVVIILLGGAIATVARRLARWAFGRSPGPPRATPSPAQAEADLMLSRLHRVLASAGVGRPAHVPPLDHARSLAGRSPIVAGAAVELVGLCYRGRYSGSPPDPGQSARARTLLGEVARGLASRSPSAR